MRAVSGKLLLALSTHFGHGSLGRRCGLLSNYFDLLFLVVSQGIFEDGLVSFCSGEWDRVFGGVM